MKHRIILIGHGNIARKYVAAFSKLDRSFVAGVVGRNAGRASAFAEEFGILVSGTDLATVAREAEATAVVICTPNGQHDESVLAASRLGLHCVCEKPLHIDSLTQQAMIDSCKANGVVLAVSYMRRFSAHLRWIKEVIDSGRLGRITVVDVMLKHYREKAYYEDSWHGTVALDGGGPFIQQGSHIIDLALWLCDGYDEVLSARCFQVYHDIEVEDHGYAVVRYRNGAVGMIEASTACVGIRKEAIEISGTKGSIIANFDGIVSLEVPGLVPPSFEEGGLGEAGSLFDQLAADFLSSIEEGRPPFITGESAAQATDLIGEIYRLSGEPEILHRS